MRTRHWNGEHWYTLADSPVKRARRWLLWVGGWERADRDEDGVVRHRWRPRVWRTHGQGLRRFPRNLIDSLTPMSMFGHRATFYGWGVRVRLGGRHLVFSRWGVRPGSPTKVYLSRDATMGNATTWIRGWPHDSEFTRLPMFAYAADNHDEDEP